MKEPVGEVVETRRIKLPTGGTLTVDMTQGFIDRLKQHFGIFGDQPLEDDHVRTYLWGALNNAVTKAEQGDADAIKQQDGTTDQPVRRSRPRRGKKSPRG